MLNLEAEVFALSVAFPRVLRRITPTAPDIAANLLRKLRSKEGSPSIWAEQFGVLTVLYPLLQAETLQEKNRDELRQANLIHLCLLLYAFVDDRICDGQVSLNEEEVRFVEELRSLSLNALIQNCHDTPEFETWMTSRQETYQKELENSYSAIGAGPTGLERSEAFHIASTRAAYGAFAAIAVLHGNRADDARIRIARNAYDSLVTGMQWIDDLKDWRDDLVLGDENLLLTTLRIVGAADIGALLESKCENEVGLALYEFGVFNVAIQHATRWLELAAHRQVTIGCPQLASLIRNRISDGEALLHTIERSITPSSC